jgi:hypothetical protein
MTPDDPREMRFKYPEELQFDRRTPAPALVRPSLRWWPWTSPPRYSSSLKNASRVRNV